MKKQTAVEFLVEEITNSTMPARKAIEQAKAMEREQIIDAHGDEQSHLQDDGSWRTVTAEQYYNETYK